jgi:rhamnosyl/mannosyltransferase
VLHVSKYYPPYYGGIESHVHTLCSELGKYIDVAVLAANTTRKEQEDMREGVPVTRAATLVRIANAPICLSMGKKIRDSRADLVHIHAPNPSATFAYFASGFRGPLILTWHYDILRRNPLKNLFSRVERRLLGRAQAIIATSPDNIVHSPKLYEVRSKCRVIPIGISVAGPEELDTQQICQIRKCYGAPLLLSVGRMVGYKGYGYLVRAMKHISGTLLMIGDGPERLRLEAEVRALGLSDKIHFLGSVERLVPYYEACDVFVLSSISRHETFGIVQLEAMARRKPVVNTQLRSGVPFVSVNGITGVTVPPADSVALARAINVLFEDPERRSSYGLAAQNRAQSEFSLDRMVSETLRLYEEVLETDSGARLLQL